MPRFFLQTKTSQKTNSLPQWNLKDLLRHPDKDLETRSRALNDHVRSLENLRKRLSATLTPRTFLKGLQIREMIAAESSRLAAYAQLWFAQNTQNQRARAFDSQVRKHLLPFSNRTVFFDLWWQRLGDQTARRLLRHAGKYRYHLESLRRVKRHTLSEAEEQIINVKNTTGRQALDSLYDVITNGLTFQLDSRNDSQPLSREQLAVHFRNPSARVRQQAYDELFQVYSKQSNSLGDIYKTLVMDWKNEGLDLRGYSSPIAVRNLHNDIPDKAVSTLLQTCRDNRHVFQEYFRIKARICGLSQMTRYDVYAPPKIKKASYPFDQAVKLVLEAYHQFSPTLADHARQVFAERHIDAAPASGKMGGAFCYSVLPSLTPYVLLNYSGDARDVATLAHELGHAVHSMMARHHSVLTFHATLPLAETASVFGEQLLSDALLADAAGVKVKQRLLLSQLDDLCATILRQAYFVEFENQAHDLIAQGTTIDGLAQTYFHLLKEQFGRTMTIPKAFQWEWLTIPHIFRSPFYCYAYSFGNLLVLSLFQRYKKEGKPFIPQYLELLSHGGSQNPQDMLKPLGIDLCKKSFWQAGFNRIQELVESLEKTMDKKG